jgi:hypothetical protein
LQFSGVQGAEACNFIFRFAFRSKYDSVAASEGSMRPKQPTTTQSGDLFRARLEQIINMKQELVQLAGKIVVETSDTPKLLRDIGITLMPWPYLRMASCAWRLCRLIRLIA